MGWSIYDLAPDPEGPPTYTAYATDEGKPCADCGGPLHAGDTIVLVDAERFAHAECPELEEAI